MEGCTATLVLCWRDGPTRIQVANVGDSFAIYIDIASRSHHHLTASHRVSDDKENERLRSLGIDVVPGQLRLDGLQLARCLGDREFKEVYPEGIISEPHVSEVVAVTGEGGVLVVASDGLWDGISFERCTEVVLETIEDEGGLSGTELLNMARDLLVQEAVDGGSKDDISREWE